MSANGREFVEVFLQEASERLQYLREYSNILLDTYPAPAELERLYIAAHALSGTSGSYGFPLFSEVAGKLAHIFQYAMNAPIAPEAAPALLEFISEAIALLESDLIVISNSAMEATEDVAVFKQRYQFAFPAPAAPEPPDAAEPVTVNESPELSAPEQPDTSTSSDEAGLGFEHVRIGEGREALPEVLPQDDDVPAEILEFFVPEAEEHLQILTDCLLSLESSPSAEQVHRMLRAMHTIKGSAAQVGLHRISHVAHRAEDLIGRVRDGELQPDSRVIDVCLQSVDILKKFLYRQWSRDDEMRSAVQNLFVQIARISQTVISEAAAPAVVETVAAEEIATDGAPLRVLDPEEEALLAEYAQARAAVFETPANAAFPEPVDKLDEELPRKEAPAVPQSRSVRVALERLDRMMNAVGELVINRTRMIGRLSQLEGLAEVLDSAKSRMQDKVSEFQEKHEFSRIHNSAWRGHGNDSFAVTGYQEFTGSHAYGASDFSELEMDRYDDFNILSRSLTEISADISEVLSQLGGFVRRVDSDIDEFTKLAHRLQDEITQARMLPIGNLYTRLSRTVRDAAKAAGKRAELKLEGAETELDNNIIQQISDPLIHLVRNAVAHGIEAEEERYQLGKSDVGIVTVRAYHRGNHIFVEVEDDGKGIDYEKVRSLAVEHGLAYPEAAPMLTQDELLEILFQPGFTTAPRKTELAGRGVGLDVVRSNLLALNGEISVDSNSGLGTRFTLKVPLTLVISQALFVRCGQTMFAVPLTFIEEIRRVKAEEIHEIEGRMMTRVREAEIEVIGVDVTLGLERIEPMNGYYRMVVVNATGRQVGLIVEDVVRKDEIVIKSLGNYLKKIKMFPGATIAPDGSLILLLDVNRLVSTETIDRAVATGEPAMTVAPVSAARVFAPGAEAVAAGAIPQEAIDVVRDEKVVVLVDDSISVRKFVGRMLEKAGYRVKLAADGLEALELIAQTRCDLVVTDLEMPRTNGYELLAHLRNNPQTRSLPVMVVTSRAGAKHRDRAMKDGAAAFLTKPVQEDHFIAAVGRLIGVSTDPAAARAVSVN